MDIRQQNIKNAGRFCIDTEESFTEERINNIVEQAQNAFWAKVVELVPEANTGNFPQDIAERFNKSINESIKTWIRLNAQ